MRKNISSGDSKPGSGDPGRLFEELGRAVYGYALGMLGNQADAEEVLAETFLRVCSRGHQYQAQGSKQAWVLSITYRLCLDSLRAKVRHRQQETSAEQYEATEDSPEAQTERKERRELVIAAIERLPAEQKEVVLLKIYGGLTFSQISQNLKIPLNTALGRMHLALKRLGRDPDLGKFGRVENDL